MDDDRLGALLRAREVRDSGIKDFFDLADRLLDRSNVAAALVALDRFSLLGLSTGRPLDEQRARRLEELALTVDDEPYDAVAETLAELVPQLADEAAPAALEAVSQVDARFTDHTASERAFATTFAVLEIVEELRRQSARELARGGIALPDSKRLAVAAGSPLDAVPALVAVAASAGLVALADGAWSPTPEASEWQLLDTVERWLALAVAWIGALPDDLRALLAERRHARWGEHLADWVRWLYPASGDWMTQRIVAQSGRAELLGITADGAPSTPGTHILGGDERGAAEAMAPLFPTEVDKVYLQHDLTIVSPGPLAAPLDSRLRELADVETRGLATTYRVSAESLNRAIYSGATADSIRDLLSGISLTGIPQPLDYLIAETARRHALVRVGREGVGSYVRSDDADLLGAIRVDQRLSSLGFAPAGDRLETRLDPGVVYWALSDARYPVAAEDTAGNVVSMERVRIAAPRIDARDHAREIVERLRAAAGPDDQTGSAWLERQLDLAIKARIPVIVVITMPNGSTADYLLEPTGLGGGRLRARDRKADIERTLPLASIVEVRPAD